MKSNINEATSKWSQSCSPTGIALHTLLLKPLKCLKWAKSPLDGVSAIQLCKRAVVWNTHMKADLWMSSLKLKTFFRTSTAMWIARKISPVETVWRNWDYGGIGVFSLFVKFIDGQDHPWLNPFFLPTLQFSWAPGPSQRLLAFRDMHVDVDRKRKEIKKHRRGNDFRRRY